MSPVQLLKGIRIASFTQFLLGPAAVQYLADMGAEVVKIESPAGAWERGWSGGNAFMGGESVFFMLTHRNVRDLTLNLKTPKGLEVARKLVSGVDVVVENFRPGVMARFGLDYESVAKLNPKLVYASASGYGSDSPYRDLPGQDLMLQAVSGLAWINGRTGESPRPMGATVVDQHGASLLAMGVLGALVRRERTGMGEKIEVSMLDAAMDLQQEALVCYLNGGDFALPREPLGSAFHPAPYGLYATSDGHVAISIQPLEVILEALGIPAELIPGVAATDAYKGKDEIYRIVAERLATKTTSECLEVLDSRGIWCTPVNDYRKAIDDPRVKAADPVLEVEHPGIGDTVKLLRHPIRFGSGKPSVRRPPPLLGQHTDQILGELGYTDEEITELHESGAV